MCLKKRSHTPVKSSVVAVLVSSDDGELSPLAAVLSVSGSIIMKIKK